MNDHNRQEILTLAQAADYLRCSTNTVYRQARSGEIPAFRLGGSWRLMRSELDNWIRRQTREAFLR